MLTIDRYWNMSPPSLLCLGDRRSIVIDPRTSPLSFIGSRLSTSSHWRYPIQPVNLDSNFMLSSINHNDLIRHPSSSPTRLTESGHRNNYCNQWLPPLGIACPKRHYLASVPASARPRRLISHCALIAFGLLTSSTSKSRYWGPYTTLWVTTPRVSAIIIL